MSSLAEQEYVVETPACFVCKKSSMMVVPFKEFMAYQLGALLQDAFPNMEAAEREQFKTGTHPKCWDKVFGGHNG